MQNTVPIILPVMCTMATRRAFLVVPMLESRAVAQVPMLSPITSGIAMPYVMQPVRESACKMPTLAALLCIIPVKTRPTSTPKNGLLNAVSIPVNSGISASGATEPLISVMPYINMAKPTNTPPMSFFFCVLHAIIIITPIRATIGEKFSGLRRFIKMLSPLMPERESIHAVRVVPILPPSITLTVCSSCIMPLFTRPTSITVRAEDD